MFFRKKRNSDPGRQGPRRWSAWRILTAWIVALTVAAAILIAFRQEMAMANAPPPVENGIYQVNSNHGQMELSECSSGGQIFFKGTEIAELSPPDSRYPREAASEISKGCGLKRVWTATMTVGVASDSTITYKGYAPPLAPDGGDLDDTEFSHKGIDYRVEAVFYQEVIGGIRQLVFTAGSPLSDELVLQAGHRQFFVSDSLKLGSNGDIHAWRLNRPLIWAQGQTVELQLRATR